MLHHYLVYFVDLHKNNPWRSEICSFSSGLFTWSLQVTATIHCSKFVDVYIGNWFWWHIKPWYYNLHYLIHYYKNYHWDLNFENIDFKDIFNQAINIVGNSACGTLFEKKIETLSSATLKIRERGYNYEKNENDILKYFFNNLWTVTLIILSIEK